MNQLSLNTNNQFMNIKIIEKSLNDDKEITNDTKIISDERSEILQKLFKDLNLDDDMTKPLVNLIIKTSCNSSLSDELFNTTKIDWLNQDKFFESSKKTINDCEEQIKLLKNEINSKSIEKDEVDTIKIIHEFYISTIKSTIEIQEAVKNFDNSRLDDKIQETKKLIELRDYELQSKTKTIGIALNHIREERLRKLEIIKIIDSIFKIKKEKSFSLSFEDLNGFVNSDFFRCDNKSNLISLNIRNINNTMYYKNDVYDKSFKLIAKCSDLISLRLINCYAENFDQLLCNIKSLSNITELNLSGACYLNEFDGSIFDKLMYLDLKNCGGLKTLKNIDQCLNLDRLKLSGCSNLPNNEIAKIKNLTNLVYLNLNECKVPCIPAVLKKLTNITSLSLRSTGVWWSQNESKIKTIQKLTNLCELNLTYNNDFTDDQLNQLSSLKTLRILDLRGCSKVSVKAIIELQEKLSFLRVIGK